MSGLRPFDGDTGGDQGVEVGRGDRIAITDPAIDPDAKLGRVAGATVGGDHHAYAIVPAGPRAIERRAAADVASGEDEGVHGAMLPAWRTGDRY